MLAYVSIYIWTMFFLSLLFLCRCSEQRSFFQIFCGFFLSTHVEVCNKSIESMEEKFVGGMERRREK